MSIHVELDEHCPACGKSNLMMTVTARRVSVNCLCAEFGLTMSQKVESAQAIVLGMLRGELPTDGTKPKQQIARGMILSELEHNLFHSIPRMISLRFRLIVGKAITSFGKRLTESMK